MNTADNIARAVVRIQQTIFDAADAIASEDNLPNAEALRLIWGGLSATFDSAPPGELDGRTARWRCRFRLYDQRDELQADSDPELSPEAAGTQIIAGLPGVAVELGSLAAAFHGTTQLRGLSTPELERRLRGLRPTLSRRKGNAVWRVPYDTPQTWREAENHTPAWLARVDIERVGT
jgi:hypothetical protein